MNRRSLNSICYVFFRHPFGQSPRPTSSSSFNSNTVIQPVCVSDFVSLLKPPIYSIPNSDFQSIAYMTRYRLPTEFTTQKNLRKYSSETGNSVGDVDTNKEVDKINLKFAEAREEIEMALESKETVYFDEEAECARAVVKEVLEMFDGLLARLPESEKAALQRSMGLKIEQLKAELRQLDE
ncbi:putative Late embryogenesis abundant protein [Quillaja saponaria]|uniref:Late embryogenesis abundant protein n=1 Tax=Quillaja saponaria TaxID=32244 RepID=A0AAD7M4C8_QUISA|nr:putative Late embryogenesis abundant protein [Quillaja saponaria]